MHARLRSAIRTILLRPLLPLGGLAMCSVAMPAELPVVCVAGSCGSSISSWVGSGSATAVATQNTLTVNQTSDRVILNWASFNVSADGRVIFNQPNSSAIALNRIFQDSPSQIFGAVEANGQIYLVNPNGFVFGRTARINAAGILASTLSLSDQNFDEGLLSSTLLRNNRPALGSDDERTEILDANGQPVLGDDGKPLKVRIAIQEGAQLSSSGAGGRVLLASPEIDNAGSISAADGQVLLAAGKKVYLQASSDPALRGLLVEVDAGGEVWNRMTGALSAARGNVTVVGLAVNQAGRISATTTVAANGSIRLLARDTAEIKSSGSDSFTLGATNGGTLDIQSGSRIEVLPELDDPTTAVDDQPQLQSSIELNAREVFLRSNSQIVAPSANLTVTAASLPNVVSEVYDQDARIRVEDGAEIDLSGVDVTLPMSRNIVAVELRANELRDNPAQRDGALRGQTVFIDARIGTSIADVSGALDAIPRTIGERMSTGGKSVLNSAGDIVVADNALFDVSGGVIHYTEGPLRTSQLIGADGKLYDIGSADPSRTYVGILNPSWRRVDDRWGFVEVTGAPGIGHVEPGYDEGRSAGTLQFAAPHMILNGTLRGTAFVGPYQRQADQAPAGGQLVIGVPEGVGSSAEILNFRAPSVTFSLSGNHSVAVSDQSPLLSQQALELPIDYVVNGGFTRTAIYSNGNITVQESTPLSLAAGSSLALTGQSIDILGTIASAGGAISANAVRTVGANGASDRAHVNVGSGVTLDVRGNWTNDVLTERSDPFGRPGSSVYLDGGSLSLITTTPLGAEIVLGDESQLLVSGGGWLQQNGTLVAGNGGSIEIDAGSLDAALEVGKDVALEGFGTLGGKGGSFALVAPRIEVGSGTQWAAQQRVDPLHEDPLADRSAAMFRVGSSLFYDYGFENVSLTASGAVDPEGDQDALRILGGTSIQMQARVRQMRQDNALLASADNIGQLSDILLPEEFQRRPVNAAFNVIPGGFTGASRVGRLNVESGVAIEADPGAAFSFAGVGGIAMNGSVRSHGGSISMSIPTPNLNVDSGYLAGLRIELGATSVLDVSGSMTYTPGGTDLLQGTLLDGGSVDLKAERGSVIVDSGASVDVSGTSGLLDLRSQDGSGYQRQRVASNAGTLSITAPESIAFNGALSAHAGEGDTGSARGGELSVSLSRQRGWVPDSSTRDTYSTDPRVLRVTSDNVVLGGNAQSGFAVVKDDLIESSGIDALRLEADDRIELDAVSLSLGRSLTLDTPNLAVRNDSDVELAAPYVAIGNSLSRTPVTPTVGKGSLSIAADFIDMIGASSISGVSSTLIASTGDLRVRQNEGTTATTGSLQVAGDLTLRATQLYPVTLTNFSISVLAGENSASDDKATLRLESSGPAPAVPLSAGGVLSLNAPVIEQAGTIRAPFGSIVLNASDTLLLADGSVTSVSGDGALIPFGRIENGVWLYDLAGNATTRTALPERRITLQAPEVISAPGAVVDLKGGGDLYAYEFVPGTGGSDDALAATATSTQYAILPSLRNQYAPYDPQEYANSGLVAGDSVYLSGIPGLEAGFYPLLPARYALLPGALLIDVVAGTTDMQAGTQGSLSDGTPVVAGYRTSGTSGVGGARYSGFAIRSGSFAHELATYEDTLASTFYATADGADTQRQVQPFDAGILSLLAGESLDMRGRALLNPAKGGLAGRVELSGTNVEILADGFEGTEGAVQLAASVLNGWQAGQLWIGGTRSADGTVAVSADTVRIGSGAALSADEILLLAREEVTVDSGASLSSTAGRSGALPAQEDLAEINLSLGGANAGAAVFGVSDLGRLTTTRESYASLSTGTVSMAAGSTVTTRGSLLADAPAQVALDGDFRATGASWSLASDTVRFTDLPLTTGLAIDTPLLSQLQSAGSLFIAGNSVIQFDSAISLGSLADLRELTLTGAALQNNSGGDVRFAAGTVRLRGLSSSPVVTAGTGTLSVTADNIELGSGTLGIGGFSRAALSATNDITGIDATTLRVAADLDLTAGRITGTSGGNTQIDAAGHTIRIASAAGAESSDRYGLGASLTMTADVIEQAGVLYAPSGYVGLDAATRLSLLDGSVIDVSGQAVTATGRTVGSDGGTIQLASGGSLEAAAGSRLDVSGISGFIDSVSNAGRLTVYAAGAASIDAQLRGLVGDGSSQGGAFDLYAGTLTGVSSLNSRLQAGGFDEQQSLHVASGDLTLGIGEQVAARTIEWTSDSGQVNVAGTMIAQADEQRSAIRLNGGAGVSVSSSARLSADGNATARNGGDILIGTSNGTLSIASGSAITAKGLESSGTLRLRAPATATDVGIATLAGTISDVAAVVVEPVRVYDVTEAPTVAQLNTMHDDASTYIAAAGANIRSRLNAAGTLPLSIEPGVELHRQGDLNLTFATPLDLSTWRFDGSPVALTVRATGSITINGTITDGFQTFGVVNQPTYRLGLLDSDSATMRFTAGANLGSADTRAVVRNAAADLTLGTSTTIRTGTGDLQLGAARDIVFTGVDDTDNTSTRSSASVYTGGRPGAPVQILTANASFNYPTGGGDLSLIAGRDVVGRTIKVSPSSTTGIKPSISEWLQRQGSADGITGPTARRTQWGVDLRRFVWNAGTLGGGDVTVAAGRDVTNLSAAAADSGIEATEDTITRYGGGSMSVDAGRNISSAMLYAARGVANIHADGALTSSRAGAGGEALGSLIMLGDTVADITARGGIALEAIVNPTVMLQPGVSPIQRSLFFTYTDDSAANVRSSGGDIQFASDSSRLKSFLNDVDPSSTQILPASLSLMSMTGDVSLAGTATLFPADDSYFELFAARDLKGAAFSVYSMSDQPANAVPTPTQTAADLGSFGTVVAASGRHAADETPVRITAGRDMVGLTVQLPEQGELQAGRDIVNTELRGQNLRATDVTSYRAGRDILFTGDSGQITIGGPGRVDVIAGRDLDLGQSTGITTVGRLVNPELRSESGADLNVLVGVGASLELNAFIDTVVAKSEELRQRLVEFMQARLQRTLTYAEAEAGFKGLAADVQRPLLFDMFFDELVASGREVNADPALGFDRGYRAIDALFPGSRAEDGSNPFHGNLTMASSRIYTLAGGDISLFVPGGSVDVGLATAAPNAKVKKASELGIVAQGAGSVRMFASEDVLVNTSRVFTLLGGDIAIWSTFGDIDAGRGAKSSVSAPPPAVLVDSSGKVTLDFAGAVAGSGIRTIATAENVKPGNVDLIAPKGIVNAGDAGIGSSGNLNIAAQQVVGLDNIQVGGVSTGVPPETSGLGASLAGVSAVASSSSSAATSSVEGGAEKSKDAAPLAETALSWLEVFVVGLGEENCKQDDMECLKRQKLD